MLGFVAAVPTIDAGIQKHLVVKVFQTLLFKNSKQTTLRYSQNLERRRKIMIKILHNAITKNVITEVKEQKVGFLRKLFINLAASLIADKPNTSGSS